MSKEIEGKLTRIGISLLTEDEWKIVILALIYDDADMDAAVHGRKVHPKLKELPRLWLGQLAEGRDGAIVAAASIIRNSLSPSGRTKFSDALSDLIQKEFLAASLGGEDENPVFRELFRFAAQFEGALKAEVAEKIVLSDLSMAFRVGAANLIASREFRSGSSTEFWGSVREMVQKHPDFLHPLIRYYVYRHADRSALELLEQAHTAPSAPKVLGFTLGTLYERFANSQQELWTHFQAIPDWLKLVLREEVFCFQTRRSLLELMEG